jgi:hypothetical protein
MDKKNDQFVDLAHRLVDEIASAPGDVTNELMNDLSALLTQYSRARLRGMIND